METATVHGFLFLRVPGGRRAHHEAERVRAAVASAEQGPGVVAVTTYSLVGLRSDADLGFWIAATSVPAYQAAAHALGRTDLDLTASLWGFVRASPYTGRSGTSIEMAAPRKRYLVVYPFTKTHDWYQLAGDARRKMMTDHARVGHGFEGIDQLLLYCTGLSDWEFVVGYETDDLERFSDLVTTLRSTAVRPYTLRDTPTFTGRFGPLEETLRDVFG